MKLYTDYPFTELGDVAHQEAPIREIELKSYDGNKYCVVEISPCHQSMNYGVCKRPNGHQGKHSRHAQPHLDDVKAGYIYTKSGRSGEVPTISLTQLKKYEEK